MRIFWMTLISVFTIVSLQYLGVKPPKILSAQIIKKENVNIPNYFRLKKQENFSLPLLRDFQKAKTYAVVDFNNGNILAEKNLSKKVAIASLTKIMTAVVALDLASPDEEFTISSNAPLQKPTIIGVVPRQKMTLEELLNASLLTSANDASEVIEEGINKKYGKDIFVTSMNEKAKFLGLKNTHFTNPQGFDNRNNYSSAEDLIILSHYALENYPLIAQIVKKDYQFIPENQNHKLFDLYNWNGLLGVYPNILGVKIGNTSNAGNTIVVLSKRQGKKVIVALLGAPSLLERDLWASELLDLGFEKIANLAPIAVTEKQLEQKYSTWKYGG